MGRKRHPIYDVDRETQKLLEACLNLAAQTAQIQITCLLYTSDAADE